MYSAVFTVSSARCYYTYCISICFLQWLLAQLLSFRTFFFHKTTYMGIQFPSIMGPSMSIFKGPDSCILQLTLFGLQAKWYMGRPCQPFVSLHDNPCSCFCPSALGIPLHWQIDPTVALLEIFGPLRPRKGCGLAGRMPGFRLATMVIYAHDNPFL